ncbi:lysine N(6)-hydroxylase/L-ornithine N(5)-oxygenase family protein [Legionella hackeliae]|uniref:L-lysine 6-monooxygenase (NADPH) n=1 Tax=Legionella hackeliae TaxID=449 RepID=A0A0A8UTH0_LEGHA|nr:SidA/IucD/PvdA family monooxygenase [Legionella hackeliae]KTD14188.1 L-lysine N6-monooxygenase [Legionella hackeliae]CEK10397.1 L-lysine 6-monooxygenase (NADPH) [Legionella hackeliae]STX47133.1 L-lysine 6-monooxygenase [Legionella hackeliae]
MLYHLAEDVFDLLGVGIGPFNLSLAALLTPTKEIKSSFFDQNKSFIWHPGMLLPDAELQVSFLYDLVTLVDPTNPYSFISYLAKNKRLYRFLNAQFKQVPRGEFSEYLSWVSRSLPNLFFEEKIEDITFNNSLFTITTTQRKTYSRNLVLGSGLKAKIPSCGQNLLGQDVFHSKDFLLNLKHWHGKKIVVLGGGQSGAEIVHYLLSHSSQFPEKLFWITKRNQFSALDDSTFSNEFFTPQYADYFFSLDEKQKAIRLHQQILASDGISLPLLDKIYQKLYKLEFIEDKGHFFRLIINHQLIKLARESNHYHLVLSECEGNNKQIINADIVIFCTGYEWEFPDYLSSLANRIPLKNGQFYMHSDFSIQWDGPKKNRIYAQNASRQQYGIAEPNLTLMAWRSAKIINSLCNAPIYQLDAENTALDLQTQGGFKYALNEW